MNKNINIERHYEKIIQSEVNLFEIASNEIVEQGLILLSNNFGSSNVRESCRDRVYLRRGIFDKLIEDTGGIVKLSNIGLKNLANPEDDYITAGVLTPILLYGARDFSQDSLNYHPKLCIKHPSHIVLLQDNPKNREQPLLCLPCLLPALQLSFAVLYSW